MANAISTAAATAVAKVVFSLAGGTSGIGSLGSTATAIATKAASITYATTQVIVSAGIAYGVGRVLHREEDVDFAGREALITSGVEPQKIVFGTAVVGGVIAYQNSVGSTARKGDQSDFWVQILIAGHEVEDIVGFYLNDDPVLPIEEHTLRDRLDRTDPLSNSIATRHSSGFYRDPSGRAYWSAEKNASLIDWSRNAVTRGRYNPTETIEGGTSRGTAQASGDGRGVATGADKLEPDKVEDRSTIDLRDRDAARNVRAWKYLGKADQEAPEVLVYDEDRDENILPGDSHAEWTEGIAASLSGLNVIDFARLRGFVGITTTYRNRGLAHLIVRFRFGDSSAHLFGSGAPTIRAIVKGHKLYDPRRDPDQPFVRVGTTTGQLATPVGDIVYEVRGEDVHEWADLDTWTWSANPILCAATFETIYRRTTHTTEADRTYRGVAFGRFDWARIAEQADICDEMVLIPGPAYRTTRRSTYTAAVQAGRASVQEYLDSREIEEERRFECNGALSLGDSPAANVTKILASCGGSRTIIQGKINYFAAAYREPINNDAPLDEDHIGDTFDLRTGIPYSDRINTIVGTVIDRRQNYQQVQVPPVSFSEYRTRDRGEASDTVAFEMTSSAYQVQRLAYIILRRANQQRFLTLPVDLGP